MLAIRACKSASVIIARIEGLTLKGAELSGWSLADAYLRGFDLSQARLRNTCFRRADLAKTNLCGADLTGADLTGAVMDGVVYDERTVWPEGYDPTRAGACCTYLRAPWVVGPAEAGARLRAERLRAQETPQPGSGAVRCVPTTRMPRG